MAASRTKRFWKSGPGRYLRLSGKLMVLLAAIPAVMVPIYGFIQPISVPMLMRYVAGERVQRDWVPVGEVSDRLKTAVIMSEDGQFCRHWGVDISALREEVGDFMDGQPVRGASTITMQLARNLFLWNDRSYLRKVLEIPLALYIDLILPKRRIMEIYLNIAEWGPNGEFGIAAGSKAGFGIPPSEMNWRQASLLAVSLTNPHLRIPARPSERMSRIADIVSERAQQYGARADCV